VRIRTVIPRATLSVACLCLCGLDPAESRAQGAAESALTTSKVGAAASAAKPPAFAIPPPSAAPSKAPAVQHLPPRATEEDGRANREALEQKAGEDAGRVLLRSVPSGARVWMDGSYVGTTPLLLLVAPGSYRAELSGEQTDFVAQLIEVPPHGKQTVVVTLKPRYPSGIRRR
jgi:hypothetical protein